MNTSTVKISTMQVFWLLFTLEVNSEQLFVFRRTIILAKQDAWMSILLGGLIGLIFTWFVVKFCVRFSQFTVVELAQQVLGEWPVRLLIFPFSLIGLIVIGANLHIFIEFVHLSLFERTPLRVLMFCFFIPIIYLTYHGGIEAIARCGQVIGPLVLITIVIGEILNSPNLSLNLMRPVYVDTGWWSILVSSFFCAFFYSQSLVLLMLVAFMVKPREAMSASLWSGGIVTVIVTSSCMVILMIFGPNLSSRLLNPIVEIMRFISIVDFIQNVDLIDIVVSMMSYITVFSLYLFFICFALGQSFGMKNWRVMIVPTTLVFMFCSIYPSQFALSIFNIFTGK